MRLPRDGDRGCIRTAFVICVEMSARRTRSEDLLTREIALHVEDVEFICFVTDGLDETTLRFVGLCGGVFVRIFKECLMTPLAALFLEDISL